VHQRLLGYDFNIGINLSNGQVDVGKGWLSALAFMATILLSGLLKNDAKATLVFWRTQHPLPGCRAFTEHHAKDHRVDPDGVGAQTYFHQN